MYNLFMSCKDAQELVEHLKKNKHKELKSSDVKISGHIPKILADKLGLEYTEFKERKNEGGIKVPEKYVLKQEFDSFKNSLEDFIKIQKEFNKEQKEFNTKITKKLDNFIDEQKIFNKEQREFNKEQREFNKEQREINKEQREFNKEQREFDKEQIKINSQNSARIEDLSNELEEKPKGYERSIR